MNRRSATPTKTVHDDRKKVYLLIGLCVVGALVLVRSIMGGPFASEAQPIAVPSSDAARLDVNGQIAALEPVMLSPVGQRPAAAIRDLFAFDPAEFGRPEAPPAPAPKAPAAAPKNYTGIADLKVQGTTSGSNAWALINGKLYREGERIDSTFSLKKIGARYITVEADGKEFRIEF